MFNIPTQGWLWSADRYSGKCTWLGQTCQWREDVLTLFLFRNDKRDIEEVLAVDLQRPAWRCRRHLVDTANMHVWHLHNESTHQLSPVCLPSTHLFTQCWQFLFIANLGHLHSPINLQCLPHLTQAPSLPFNSHFPVGPGSAGSRMSPFSILLKQRMMKVVVTTGAIRCAKLQSNHHHQQTNTQLFTGQIPFLSLNQQCQSTEGKNQHYWYLIKLFIKLFKTSGLPMFLSFRLGRQISDE